MSNDSLPELYTDGISNLEVSNGMVRMDLYSLSGKEKEADGAPSKVERQRIIMSPQGFLECFSTMQNMFQKLEEAGLLKRQDDGGDTTEQNSPNQNDTAVENTAADPKSPNFS
jgi:hypothetical protein